MHRSSIAVIAVVSTVAFTQIAAAADLPRKAPPPAVPPAPVYNWTGWYVGLNAGGHWGNNTVDSVGVSSFADPSFLSGSTDIANSLARLSTYSLGGHNNGFIGGGQIGYNWQFGKWLAGLEADIQGLTHSSDTTTQGATINLINFPAEHYNGFQSASSSFLAFLMRSPPISLKNIMNGR